MTHDQRMAWWGLGGLLGLTALGFAFDPDRRSRALVVDNPAAYKRPGRRRRARRKVPTIAREIAACERFARKEARPQTFKRKREAVRALLDANPELAQLVESDCGGDCIAYGAWEARGRRGPKPRARRGDGRFDALNERFEKRTPGRKVASWREALAVTAPSSRRWEDFAGRVPVLEEATGFRLNMPARTDAVHRARLLADRCQDIADRPQVVDVIPF